MASVNEATGEVTVELDGKTFRLRATMPRLAAYGAALGAKGLGGIHEVLAQAQPLAVYEGMRCLCVSGNEAALDDMLLMPILEEAMGAVSAALVAGLPKARPGNSDATTATRRSRGRDTVK